VRCRRRHPGGSRADRYDGQVAHIRLALCQLNAVVGDLDANVERVLAALDTAEREGADLAVFPELMLTGYPPEDLLLEPAFIENSQRCLARIAAATRECAAVVGFVEGSRDLHNAAAVMLDGEIRGVWRKEELPNYGVFDERRWFTPGNGDTPLFEIAGVRVGVTICEDAWSPSGPVARQAAGGAELIVSLNASPYRKGVLAERERMLATRAADSSCALAYVNLVGGQDELVFDGASMLFDIDGALVASGPQFEEAVVICDLEVRGAFRKRILEPRGRSHGEPIEVVALSACSRHLDEQRRPQAERLDAVGEVYRALALATHDYVVKNRFSDVVIGLSGGVDSALVATLAVDALGADHVHGVALPSRYSSEHSLSDAKALADNLGIDYRVIAIEPAHAALLEVLEPSFAGRAPDLTEENLQARIRGTIVMALSNKFGWLVLTTGNKSEMAVGYATLYGDMAGGFAVIKDVPKLLVYACCEWRNAEAGHDLIPDTILTKAPSAELRPDQRDEDSLPPYVELDPIIEGYVEGDLSVTDLVTLGHDEATVRRVIQMIDLAEYKRRQAPPGARVTSRAFGKDRRMPITSAYRAANEHLTTR
jgi:NAD+ synthase (glutamine-hydrolysing)